MDFDSCDYDDIPSTSSINLKFIKSVRRNSGFRMEVDDYDDEEEESIYQCPYCSEDYGDAELVEYHIREAHPSKADFDSESCPVCAAKVGKDMVEHLILKHDGRFDIEQLLKLKKAADSHDKEFLFGSSRTSSGESFLGGRASSKSNGVSDDLLSFICEVPPPKEIHSERSNSSDLCIDAEGLSGNKQTKRVVLPSPPMAEKRAAEDKEARSRCNFAQGLMFSALFDDDL